MFDGIKGYLVGKEGIWYNGREFVMVEDFC